jgi:hypothetical protein
MITVALLYNGHPLDQLLKSVDKQTYKPSSITIIDGKHDLPNKYKSIDVIKVTIGSNLIDEAIKHTNTEFVSIIADTVVLYPLKLEESIGLINQNPKISFVYSDYDEYHVKTRRYQRLFQHPYDTRIMLQQLLFDSNSLYRTKEFKSPEFLFETDLQKKWIHIAQKSLLAHTPDSLYLKRIYE